MLSCSLGAVVAYPFKLPSYTHCTPCGGQGSYWTPFCGYQREIAFLCLCLTVVVWSNISWLCWSFYEVKEVSLPHHQFFSPGILFLTLDARMQPIVWPIIYCLKWTAEGPSQMFPYWCITNVRLISALHCLPVVGCVALQGSGPTHTVRQHLVQCAIYIIYIYTTFYLTVLRQHCCLRNPFTSKTIRDLAIWTPENLTRCV